MSHGRSWTPMDLAVQRLRHALSPALWGFPAVASNERSPTNKRIILKSRYLNKIQNSIFIYMSSLHQTVITLICAADTLSKLLQI